MPRVDAYGLIRKIEAVEGGVTITIVDKHVTKKIEITVDEALDRAEALRGMVIENSLKHGETFEMYTALMRAAGEARAQQRHMERAGTFVDFRIKESNKRALEIEKLSRGVTI